MYETKAKDLKKHLEKALSAKEVTHAYLVDYAVHLFIVVGQKTTHYLYIKNDKTNEIIGQFNKFAIQPLNAANRERRYFLDKHGIQTVDEEFDSFFRSRYGVGNKK
jgi:hypothetical protein